MIDWKILPWEDIQYSRAQKWKDITVQSHVGRWTKIVLNWQAKGIRKRGHPKQRWEEQFQR